MRETNEWVNIRSVYNENQLIVVTNDTLVKFSKRKRQMTTSFSSSDFVAIIFGVLFFSVDRCDVSVVLLPDYTGLWQVEEVAGGA